MTIAKTFPVPYLPLVQVVPSAEYPEGPSADAIEEQVQQSLPPLEGLENAHSLDERLALYREEIARQRAVFMSIHGHDALGSEGAELSHSQEYAPAGVD